MLGIAKTLNMNVANLNTEKGMQTFMNQTDMLNKAKESANSEISDKDALKELAGLKTATEDFESLMMNQMLSIMRKSISNENNLMHGGKGEEMFQSMLDQQWTSDAASSGGLGLSKSLFEQLSVNIIKGSSELRNMSMAEINNAVQKVKAGKSGYNLNSIL